MFLNRAVKAKRFTDEALRLRDRLKSEFPNG
jgi:hypothetical protein